MTSYVWAGIALIGIAVLATIVTIPIMSAVDCDINNDGTTSADGWEGICQDFRYVIIGIIIILFIIGGLFIKYGMRYRL